MITFGKLGAEDLHELAGFVLTNRQRYGAVGRHELFEEVFLDDLTISNDFYFFAARKNGKIIAVIAYDPLYNDTPIETPPLIARCCEIGNTMIDDKALGLQRRKFYLAFFDHVRQEHKTLPSEYDHRIKNGRRLTYGFIFSGDTGNKHARRIYLSMVALGLAELLSTKTVKTEDPLLGTTRTARYFVKFKDGYRFLKTGKTPKKRRKLRALQPAQRLTSKPALSSSAPAR